MDLDALEEDLEAARAQSLLQKERSVVTSYQQADPYSLLTFRDPSPPRKVAPRISVEDKKMRKKKKAQDLFEPKFPVGTIERLEEELLQTTKGAEGAEAEENSFKHLYPKMVVRDVRFRLKARGISESTVRKMERYMEEGWIMLAEEAAKQAERDRRRKGRRGRKKEVGITTPGMEDGSSGGATPGFETGRSTNTGASTNRTGTSDGGDSPREGDDLDDMLDAINIKDDTLGLLLGDKGRLGDFRELTNVDREKEKELEEALERAALEKGRKAEEELEEHHKVAELKLLLYMAGVNKKDAATCFERSELEEMLADRLIEMDRAAGVSLRFVKLGLGRVTLKRLTEQWEKVDAAIICIEAFARHAIYHRIGQQLISDLKRQTRLENLGADATVLTLLAQAKDGDIIEIPKGHHYVPATKLVKECSSPTEVTVRVERAGLIRAGSDIVVGREPMKVLDVRRGVEGGGDELVVRRGVPAILWEMRDAEKKKLEKEMEYRMKKRKEREREEVKPEDVRANVLNQWEQAVAEPGVGMDDRDWLDMVREVLGAKRDPETKSTFRWLGGAHDRINLVSTLVLSVRDKGAEGGEVGEEELGRVVDRFWKRGFSSGLLDAKGNEAYEVPLEKLQKGYMDEVEGVLLEEVRGGGLIGREAAGLYLAKCASFGLRQGRVVTRAQFEKALDALDDGSQYVTPHPLDSVVRAEGRVQVNSVVEIVGEPGTVIHGCLVLGGSLGGLYLRPLPNMPSQVLMLETAGAAGGGRAPLRLVDKNTGEEVWSREEQSLDHLHVILEMCEKQRGSVKGLAVQSGNSDAVRVEGGEWDVAKCVIKCTGESSDALVCGQGGHASVKRCELGGLDESRQCRNVVSCLEGGAVKVAGCLLACARESGLRVTSHSNSQVEKCLWRRIGAAVNGYGGASAKIEVMDNRLEAVVRLWLDDTHRPTRGHVVELFNKRVKASGEEEEVVFNDWRRAEYEREAAKLKEARARKEAADKEELEASKKRDKAQGKSFKAKG